MINIDEFRSFRNKKHKIVLDTNILLELYRQPANISLDIIDGLKKIANNIFIPRQVYEEYLKNYQKVCGDEKKKYKKVRQELSKLAEKLKQDIDAKFNDYRNHNYTDISKLQEHLNKKVEEINDLIKDYEKNHEKDIKLNTDFLKKDEVNIFVEWLLSENKVGKEFMFSEKMDILKEGKLRFENLIPPGYMYCEKEGSDKYGDLFVWKSIINTAKSENCNILFISNDIKEDWWKIDNNLPTDVRDDLLKEFKEINHDLNIHFLTLERFFSYLSEELKIGQSKSALQLSARQYIYNNLSKFNSEIYDCITDFASEIDFEIILDESFEYTNYDDDIYWNIADISVDKEGKKIIYYVKLDISIVSDVIFTESNKHKKLLIALDGNLKLLTEEYSGHNDISDIKIEIIKSSTINSEDWIVDYGSRKFSCKDIIQIIEDKVIYPTYRNNQSKNNTFYALSELIKNTSDFRDNNKISDVLSLLYNDEYKSAFAADNQLQGAVSYFGQIQSDFAANSKLVQSGAISALSEYKKIGDLISSSVKLPNIDFPIINSELLSINNNNK